jgi:hypothetical protein
MAAQPQMLDFSYIVRIAVSLPLEWTTLLKQVAAQHYDYVCREAGKQGVINGLHNTACDSEFPSSFRVTWQDLDLIAKVLEQAHYFPESADLVNAIGRWLRETKVKIEERLNVLQDAPRLAAQLRGRFAELDVRTLALRADRDRINVELQEARAVIERMRPVVEASFTWRNDTCKGLGSHREAALAAAVDACPATLIGCCRTPADPGI